MRTASSSVSGSTVSTTRAPSLLWRSAQARKSRTLPPSASAKARAWSTTKRTRRHRSRGRPCGEADLEHASLAHDAVEQLAGRRPVAGVVPLGQRPQRVADRVVGVATTPGAAAGGPTVRRARPCTCRGRRRRTRRSASAARSPARARRWDRRRPAARRAGRGSRGCCRRATTSRPGTGCRRRRARPRDGRATCAPAGGWRCRRAGTAPRSSVALGIVRRTTDQPSRSARRTTAATSAASSSRSGSAALTLVVGLGAEQHHGRADRRGLAHGFERDVLGL